MKQLVNFLFLFLMTGMVAAQTTQAYKVSVDQWQQNRIKDLVQEDGWLNL